MNERHGKGWALLREDLAKRDKNIAIQIYAVAFGILVVIIAIGGTIISLLVLKHHKYFSLQTMIFTGSWN
ncbi:MAG: hypothetical protein OXC57_12885 [Rhodobacteraceae bacterium]|nr:hypothetical protein [Paracoccaceae bacterium]